MKAHLDDVDAFPLYWPEGKPRTEKHRRTHARFDTTFASARDETIQEIRRLGKVAPGARIVISTNLPLRRDGLPYADSGKMDDPGAAVYFLRDGKRMSFACDRWTEVRWNMQAICKTIEALRGIARWGTGDMMEAAFKGFMEIPGPAQKTWPEVFGISPGSMPEAIRARYVELAKLNHPDRGGDPRRMVEINAAYEHAKKDRGFA